MKALLLIDIQNDFLPGGALAVPHGDAVIPIANQLMPYFELVVATQDWHPDNHSSFADMHPDRHIGEQIMLNGLPQILWPTHCVQNTQGAELASDLNTHLIHKIFYKGTAQYIDSYSGFFDNGHLKATGLGAFFKKSGVTEVYVMGLATDYCVKFSALDSRNLGFATYCIQDGCRGVDVQKGDTAMAIEVMEKAGVRIISSQKVLEKVGTKIPEKMFENF